MENSINDYIEDWVRLNKKVEQKIRVISDTVGSENFIYYEDRPIIGKILVLPRRSMPKFYFDKKFAIISISDDGDFAPYLPKIDKEFILELNFDDVEFKSDRFKHISPEQAKEIWDFINPLWNKIDLLVVHCNAGVSRSPAVAKAISDKYQPEFAKFFDKIYSPNPLVYKAMTEAV